MKILVDKKKERKKEQKEERESREICEWGIYILTLNTWALSKRENDFYFYASNGDDDVVVVVVLVFAHVLTSVRAHVLRTTVFMF